MSVVLMPLNRVAQSVASCWKFVQEIACQRHSTDRPCSPQTIVHKWCAIHTSIACGKIFGIARNLSRSAPDCEPHTVCRKLSVSASVKTPTHTLLNCGPRNSSVRCDEYVSQSQQTARDSMKSQAIRVLLRAFFCKVFYGADLLGGSVY